MEITSVEQIDNLKMGEYFYILATTGKKYRIYEKVDDDTISPVSLLMSKGLAIEETARLNNMK